MCNIDKEYQLIFQHNYDVSFEDFEQTPLEVDLVMKIVFEVSLIQVIRQVLECFLCH